MFLLTGAVSAAIWGASQWRGTTIKIEMGPTVVPTEEPTKKVVEEIREMTATASGTYAVYVYRLGEGQGYGINEDETMPGASILKIPALLAAWPRRGETWVLEGADISLGSGPLQFKSPGTKVTVDQVLVELGLKSDNTAWRMINRRLGMKEMEMQIAKKGLTNTNYRGLLTTARDAARMFAEIFEKKETWEFLEKSIYEDRISLGLPEGIRLVHKVGTDGGVWSDAGIVMADEPFILVIMNKGVDRDEAMGLVPEITRVVWEYESAN